jgi:hypothetical protein
MAVAVVQRMRWLWRSEQCCHDHRHRVVWREQGACVAVPSAPGGVMGLAELMAQHLMPSSSVHRAYQVRTWAHHTHGQRDGHQSKRGAATPAIVTCVTVALILVRAACLAAVLSLVVG